MRETLLYVREKTVAHRNVTLSLPEPLLRRFRVYAAERNQSMTALMTQALDALLREDDPERAKADKRFLARIRSAPDRGIRGEITWTRDEL